MILCLQVSCSNPSENNVLCFQVVGTFIFLKLGDLRLNAFQKTLKKEEITVIDRSIQGVRRLIVEQKQRIMELNDESDVAVKRVDTRREKLRVVFAEVRAILKNQNQLYDQLEAIEKKILVTKDQIGDCHQHYLEIEMDIEMSDKSIKRCVSVLRREADNSSNSKINKNNNLIDNSNTNSNNEANNDVRADDQYPLIKKVNLLNVSSKFM